MKRFKTVMVWGWIAAKLVLLVLLVRGLIVAGDWGNLVYFGVFFVTMYAFLAWVEWDAFKDLF